MKTRQAYFMRDAAMFIALSGLLLCAPMAARGQEVAAVDVVQSAMVPQRIMLPSLRAGGIPQGQVLQITEHGSELVAAARLQLAAVTQAANAARAPVEPQPAPKLICANGF